MARRRSWKILTGAEVDRRAGAEPLSGRAQKRPRSLPPPIAHSEPYNNLVQIENAVVRVDSEHGYIQGHYCAARYVTLLLRFPQGF